MQTIKFTKEEISKLQPSESRYSVGFKDLKGLQLRVGPTGIKTFMVYKKLKGKPKRITLGRFEEDDSGLTPAQAKKKAQKIMGEMAYNETDHNAQKRIERAQSITLNELHEDYKEATKLAPNTLSAYKKTVEHYLKDWKDLPISKINGDMVQARHREISKTTKSRANTTMRHLRAMFNYARDQYEDAEGRSLFSDNPVRKLKRQWHRETRRKGHIAIHQLKDWFTAVEKLPEEHKGDGVLARDYLTFILLTGLRRREATSLLWSDIDLKAKRFIVRDPKNHDELWMPLSDYLLDMLKRRKEDTDSNGPFQVEEPRRFIQKVRDLSEVQFTIHDLRRTFITIVESLDIGIYTIKALVNHRSGSNDVTEGYVQMNTERLREPMQKITNYILSAGGVRESNVVNLKKNTA